MNLHHHLKSESKYFMDIVNGIKSFEIRKNDRGFQLGDKFTLHEVDSKGTYTGSVIGAMIIRYIIYGGRFGLDEDYCIFAFSIDETAYLLNQ